MTIYERLKELLDYLSTKGITQEKFAKKIGKTQSYISMIISEKVAIKSDLIELICDNFNINREWLENGVGERDRVLPRTEAIEKFFIESIKNRSESMTNLIKAISKLSDKDLEKIKELTNILLLEEKDEKENHDEKS